MRENAKQDLKDGLVLYNSESNIGLRNAWNIIQAEVSSSRSKHYTSTLTAVTSLGLATALAKRDLLVECIGKVHATLRLYNKSRRKFLLEPFMYCATVTKIL